MQIKAHYSHLNGEEYLIVHHKQLWQEVQDVIEECRCLCMPDQGFEGKDDARENTCSLAC